VPGVRPVSSQLLALQDSHLEDDDEFDDEDENGTATRGAIPSQRSL